MTPAQARISLHRSLQSLLHVFAMINIIDLIFLNLAFFATFTGVLINNYEKYLPSFIIKGYKYGSFAYQGSDAKYLSAIEIPKSYYRHFYLFSTVFSTTTLVYMVCVYFLGYEMNHYVPIVLRFFLEEEQPSGNLDNKFTIT